jgi:ABC-type sulfate transport system substrate-binding protein
MAIAYETLNSLYRRLPPPVRRIYAKFSGPKVLAAVHAHADEELGARIALGLRAEVVISNQVAYRRVTVRSGDLVRAIERKQSVHVGPGVKKRRECINLHP